MNSSVQGSQPSISITPDNVEKEVRRLFGEGSSGLVIRVHGAETPGDERTDAFKELLESLSIYNDQYRETAEIEIEPPDAGSIYTALMVLSDKGLQKDLFRRALLTLGRQIVNPLGDILSTTPDGTLFNRMVGIRSQIKEQIERLRLSYETRAILMGDVEKLLTDDYLTMLAEHEESAQRPQAEALAQKILHLIGETLRRAFQGWPQHAEQIAASAVRNTGPQVKLRENPVVIRERIVSGIEDFLWVETSNEINGMLGQLFSEKQYQGLLEPPYPELTRGGYREFARTCWNLVTENC